MSVFTDNGTDLLLLLFWSYPGDPALPPLRSWFRTGSSMISPTFTFTDALAGFPFTMTRPASHASFATVRRLISRDTFKNLSSLMVILHFPRRHYRDGIRSASRSDQRSSNGRSCKHGAHFPRRHYKKTEVITKNPIFVTPLSNINLIMR